MKAKPEKICLDNQCQEVWRQFPEEFSSHTAKFVFCPICSEELHIQCSNCKEALTNTEFKFCPWCGCEFEG